MGNGSHVLELVTLFERRFSLSGKNLHYKVLLPQSHLFSKSLISFDFSREQFNIV